MLKRKFFRSVDQGLPSPDYSECIKGNVCTKICKTLNLNKIAFQKNAYFEPSISQKSRSLADLPVKKMFMKTSGRSKEGPGTGTPESNLFVVMQFFEENWPKY